MDPQHGQIKTEQPLEVRYAWPADLEERQRQIMDTLVRIGPRKGYVSTSYTNLDPDCANPALMEAERVIAEMARNYGRPGRHNNPNPFYTRDQQQCNVMGDLLHGKSRLVEMPTKDFIYLAADLDADSPSVKEAISRLAEKFRLGQEVDAVFFTVEATGVPGTYKILNHEGRTRAHAALQAGITTLKVYIHSWRKFTEYGKLTLISETSQSSCLTIAGSGAELSDINAGTAA